MTNCQSTPDRHVLVAIDISIYRHEVLIAVPGKKRRRRLTIQNKREDFDRLVAILHSFGALVRVGFEATGNYHRNIAYRLHQAGCELKLISSVARAETRLSQCSRNKTKCFSFDVPPSPGLCLKSASTPATGV